MSTVAEIAEALPGLTNQELRELEKVLFQTYRDRKLGILFEDAYGAFTEEDMAAIREDALRALDGEAPRP